MAAGGQSILLTGAAQGIGRCIARSLLKKGNRLFLLDIQEDELRYAAEVHLKQHRDNLSYAVCDLRDASALREAVKQAADFFGGRIDAVISNGGIASPKWRDSRTMEDPSVLEEWHAYVDTNLTAPFVLAQACIPYMKDTQHRDDEYKRDAGPCIVLVGSFRALQSDPDQEGYAATKAGLLGLMHSMAVSCSRWGIRVNLVAPGRIRATYESRRGDEEGGSWEQETNGQDAEEHPANRAGRPEDVAGAVEYLIGAGFVTGQDITVDGGATKKKTT